MAVVLDNGFVDSVTTTLNLARPDLSLTTDFAEMKRNADGSNNELTLVNLTSPSDRLETIYANVKRIDDVYSKSGIDNSRWSKSKRGIRIYIQDKTTLKVTDSDLDSVIYIPLNCSVSLEFGDNEVITPDLVMNRLSRVVAALFDKGSITSGRLGRLAKGALIPK